MEYLPYLDIQFQFVDNSYNLTVHNLYKYHELNNIPITYDGFIEDLAIDYFKSIGLNINDEDKFSRVDLDLAIAGI